MTEIIATNVYLVAAVWPALKDSLAIYENSGKLLIFLGVGQATIVVVIAVVHFGKDFNEKILTKSSV